MFRIHWDTKPEHWSGLGFWGDYTAKQKADRRKKQDEFSRIFFSRIKAPPPNPGIYTKASLEAKRMSKRQRGIDSYFPKGQTRGRSKYAEFARKATAMRTFNQKYKAQRGAGMMDEFKGKRTFSKVTNYRKGDKRTDFTAAVKRFWQNRMPILDLKTFAGIQPDSLICASGVQAILGGIGDDFCFPLSLWLRTVLNKMQRDMLTSHPTVGYGLYNDTSNNNIADVTALQTAARNAHRTGLSILSLTREYTLMNTQTTFAFVEAIEYCWKGVHIDDTSTIGVASNNFDNFHPANLWTYDCFSGDNPEWLANVAFAGDTNEQATTLGKRPNSKSKLLLKYWREEKRTKYILAPGQSVKHIITLPSMYIDPTEVDTIGSSFVKNKTRSLMWIVQGQNAFEAGASTTAPLRIAGAIGTAGATVNYRWVQMTKMRLQEHGHKYYTHYSCAHDLSSANVEHYALTTPAIMLRDRFDVEHSADRDTAAADAVTNHG